MTQSETPIRPRCKMNASRFLLLILFTLGVFAAPLCANGQELSGLKVRPSQKAKNYLVKGILRGDKLLEGNEKAFDDFFLMYGLATIIPHDPQVDVGKARINFRNQYLDGRTSRNKQARDHLNQLTMNTMTKAVANKKYNNPARINATLVIGMLEETPAQGQSNPTPLPAGCDFLLSLIEGQVAGTEDFLDPLSMPALAGIERHARYSMSPEHRQRFTQIALKWIQEEPPQGRDPEVHDFFRNRAAEVLGVLHSTGNGNEVVTALREVMNDDKLSVDPRCQIARPIGQLKFETGSEELAGDLTTEIGELTLVVLKEQVQEGLKTLDIDRQSGGRRPSRRPSGRSMGAMGGGGRNSGARGGGGARGRAGAAGRNRGGTAGRGREPRVPAQEPAETFVPREQWATQLASLQAALGNRRARVGPILALADETKKTKAQAVDKSIDKALKQLQDQYQVDQDLFVALDDVRRDLAAVLGLRNNSDEPDKDEKPKDNAEELFGR